MLIFGESLCKVQVPEMEESSTIRCCMYPPEIDRSILQNNRRLERRYIFQFISTAPQKWCLERVPFCFGVSAYFLGPFTCCQTSKEGTTKVQQNGKHPHLLRCGWSPSGYRNHFFFKNRPIWQVSARVQPPYCSLARHLGGKMVLHCLFLLIAIHHPVIFGTSWLDFTMSAPTSYN